MKNPLLNATVITLYPELFPGPLSASVTGRSLEQKIWSLETIDLRLYGKGKHKQVDDKPISGGPGMILRPDVLDQALLQASSSISNAKKLIVCMTPKGIPFTQNTAKSILQYNELIIVCGRFEGIDQRVIEKHHMKEISIGDYILTGGELGAMVLLDAVVRLLPGTFFGFALLGLFLTFFGSTSKFSNKRLILSVVCAPFDNHSFILSKSNLTLLLSSLFRSGL